MTWETSRISCDPANLGEVFGCLGLMEVERARLADGVTGQSTGCFVTDSLGPGFVLRSEQGLTLQTLVNDVLDAQLHALRPPRSGLSDPRVPTKDAPWGERVFPAPPPEKHTALPIELRAANWQAFVSSWAESGRLIGRDNAKFWAGNYTGASVAHAVLAQFSELGVADRDAILAQPWSFSMPLSSSYRMDFSRDYTALSSGFSPNKQSSVHMVGHPLVELLSAVGLEHARPLRIDNLSYSYGVPCVPVRLPLMQAVLSGADTGVPIRRFGVSLGWPGQENQARCIVRTFEENTS